MIKKMNKLFGRALLIGGLAGLVFQMSFIEVKATIPTTIAVAVDSNGFTGSNVGGDGENTLLWKKGSTTLSGGDVLLTNGSGQAGSLVKRNQIKLQNGFSTYFEMYLNDTADGIAFVVYEADTPQLGEVGGALGYGDKQFAYAAENNGIDSSIHDSIIAEFDTWKNYSPTAEAYDPNLGGYDQHVAIMLDGNQVHSQQSDPNAVYTNANLVGQLIHVWIDYEAGDGVSTPGTVRVTFGPGTSRGNGSNYTITRTISVTDNTPVAGDSVFVGFTSSTGGHATTQQINKWLLKDSYVPGGLDTSPDSYTQASATITVAPNNGGTNSTTADISLLDTTGSMMLDQTFSVYIDNAQITEPSAGAFTTGSTGSYGFSIPASLSTGTHTIRVVGEGGVTNFATFSCTNTTSSDSGSGTTSSSSGTTSSGSGTTTENITVDVKKGDSTVNATQIDITRTTASDGTKSDSVLYGENKATETIANLVKENLDTARILIPDTGVAVASTKVTIPGTSMDILAGGNINLQIDTPMAKINLAKETMQNISQQSAEDLYFRIVPVKDEEKKEETLKSALFQVALTDSDPNHAVTVVAEPVTIETNMPSTKATITLPLTGVTIPSDEAGRALFLQQLGVYIEHSDGEKELVKGELVEFAPGVYGIRFEINKFSTFTVVQTDAFNYDDHVKLGLIKNKSYATKVASIFQNDYDCSNVEMKKVGKYYRITMDFMDQSTATAACEDMKTRQYIKNYYFAK